MQSKGSPINDTAPQKIRTPVGSFWKYEKALLVVSETEWAKLAIRDEDQDAKHVPSHERQSHTWKNCLSAYLHFQYPTV